MSLYQNLTSKERFEVEADVMRSLKSSGLAYLLCVTLGVFGAHRLYLRRYLSGGAMLLGTLITIASWFFVGFRIGLIPGLELLALIDLFFIPKILANNEEEVRKTAVERVLGERDSEDLDGDIPLSLGGPKTIATKPRGPQRRRELLIRGGSRMLKES